MSNVVTYIWLIPALPLLASVIIAAIGPRILREQSHWPCILALVGSFIFSLMVFFAVQEPSPYLNEPLSNLNSWGNSPSVSVYYNWIEVGKTVIPIGLLADPLSALMLVMITFIGTWIAIYSAGYMHDDPGYPRFFAEVSLFVFSMTLLVLADNFVLLYAGWEGVGLCSYLLVGFWYNKPEAAAAARKAFLVTRIGDVGLMLGILVLWYFSSYHFDYASIFQHFRNDNASGSTNTWIVYLACLFLFCGAAGKSAQFPLHVWLPDAMEGPTPVSALIHAATMVTAGVYLIARCTPLFILSPEAQLIVACIGGFTAIFAAVIALTQNDLKRVLAYSTLSQLGYMFLALGCAISQGEKSIATFAVVAAVFHLFTHAFFKALLFLSAGSVMHAMGGVIDMRRFGGLRKVLPRTHLGFLCGSLALAGIPLFSGFWSKDEILGAAFKASAVSSRFGTPYFLLLIVGLLTAGLTGFYTFRSYFLTFWGEEKIPPQAGHHAHESPLVMTLPLMVLSIFALGLGLLIGPTHLFAHFLSPVPGWPNLGEVGMEFGLMAISSLIALGGVGLAYLFYVSKPELSGQLSSSMQGLYHASLDKLYIDDIYNAVIVTPLEWLASIVGMLDSRLVDRLIDVVGTLPRYLGWLFSYVQNGLVQFYALAMVLGLTVFILALLRSLT